MAVERGEVWLADLSPSRGTEQAGVRPVVVVQSDRAMKLALNRRGNGCRAKKRRPYKLALDHAANLLTILDELLRRNFFILP